MCEPKKIKSYDREWQSTVTYARDAVEVLLHSPLFTAHSQDFCNGDNPYRRPIRAHDFAHYHFHEPLGFSGQVSASALAAQRLLAIIYETDMLFLPKRPMEGKLKQDFETFYSDEFKIYGEIARPLLESHVFDFLRQEIDVTGKWTMDAARAFFAERLATLNSTESPVGEAVLTARRPETAARNMLVQLSSDFLTEASAMGRNVLGSYGAPLSRLFTIFMDEYGTGVHAAKHSSLYEKVMESAELATHPHHYWQFFLPSSLSLLNYFHYVSKSHRHFFRYLGALYFTEATLAHANSNQSRVLRTVFGNKIDTLYFDEHAHIDRHHGRMALEEVIEPIVKRVGESVLPDIVRGFEEFCLLQNIADDDLVRQIKWCDYLGTGNAIVASPPCDGRALQDHEEERGLLSVTHIHDRSEIIFVKKGELDIITGIGEPVHLRPGQGLIIPAGRLHGSRVVSDSCLYSIFPLDS